MENLNRQTQHVRADEEPEDTNHQFGSSLNMQMKRFRLKRNEDHSGVSGCGYVAEGMQFSDGTCVIKWLSTVSSIGIYHSEVELIHIHGHEGKTVVEWIDE